MEQASEVKLLLKNGSDPNISLEYQLLLNITNNPDIISILIKYGINVHLSDNNGNTALHNKLIIDFIDYSLIELLI